MKRKNYNLEIILSLFTFAFLSCMFPHNVWADGIGLNISPAIIQIEAKPPADVWTPFTIENQSNQPVSLTIGYKPFDREASQNGTVTFLKNGEAISGQDKKIFEKMQVIDDKNTSHDTIALGPGQKERLRLRIILPDNEPSGDYYFSLILLENQIQTEQNNSKMNIEDQKSFSSLQAGIGMNILLAIGNKEAPQATIDTFTTPLLREAGPVPFTLTVQNSGIHFITPQATILIKNMFGQTVGKVTIPSSVILAETSRTFTNTTASSYASTAKQITWPEQFLLGMYTAQLSLSLSDHGPFYTRTIHFFAFPLNLLLEIVILLLIFMYVYLRVKRKIS